MASRCHHCSGLSIEALVELAEREFSAHIFPKHAFYQHHSSFSNLEQSALQGCDFCGLILECFKGSPGQYETWPYKWEGSQNDITKSMYAFAKELDESDIKIALNAGNLYLNRTIEEVLVFDSVLVQVGPGENYDAEYVDEDEEGSWQLPPLELRLRTLGELHVRDYQIGYLKVDPDLSAKSNYDIARNWLHDCQFHHSTCLSRTARELPTRIVDVGNLGDAPPVLRLVHPQGAKGEGGNIDPVLNADTIEPYKGNIPFSELPLNFQDAITITRDLGIRYIWIDCLCILQDSPSDWLTESQNMGMLYQNSTVTISAMVSERSTHGILKGNPPIPDPRPRKLSVCSDKLSTIGISVERMSSNEESLRVLDMRAPLAARGWCLQESILSPRQLYYGNEQIYWRCPQGYASADGLTTGNRFPVALEPEISLLIYKNVLAQVDTGLPNLRNVLLSYQNLVQQYSSRSESDKLVAFSGLASRVHSALEGSYLAGLWSCNIRNCLLWIGELGTCRGRSPNDPVAFQAISWTTCQFELELIDSHITLQDDSNPYGKVLSGHLTVEGRTMPLVRSAQVVPERNEERQAGWGHFDEPVEGIDIQASWTFLAFNTTKSLIVSMETSREGQKDWDLDLTLFYPEDYLVLVVFAGNNSEEAADCLVLKRLSEQPDESYERVGTLAMYGDFRIAWIESWPSRILKLV
ncbi:HET-domain-containing protein [Microthyrium microscopicum]|uniref:HET-domain-containing protein n=1 Tax=Microthyrium microscopicum TaxID=703497 RepID=A0A6A6U174_9PEZI|nr:HET-domain-containing protein [Microthyrium microscopicum]